MNSTFKVVFNKARGALMVVNEVTSSVQAKGTKTVVAAAVATMIAGVAGTAMAAEWEVAPEGLEAATDTVITDANWAAIKDQNAFELTARSPGPALPRIRPLTRLSGFLALAPRLMRAVSASPVKRSSSRTRARSM